MSSGPAATWRCDSIGACAAAAQPLRKRAPGFGHYRFAIDQFQHIANGSFGATGAPASAIDEVAGRGFADEVGDVPGDRTLGQRGNGNRQAGAG